ncbi:MAG: hypothetical protein H6701_16625 [Myxococcales bacterium]|nr:hypothetical protein [Myxococcales bacterium]
MIVRAAFVADILEARGELKRRAGITLAVAIGRTLVEGVYDGGLARVRDRHNDCPTLRAIATHPRVPFRLTTLHHAIGVFDLVRRFREVPRTALTLTHLRLVLPYAMRRSCAGTARRARRRGRGRGHAARAEAADDLDRRRRRGARLAGQRARGAAREGRARVTLEAAADQRLQLQMRPATASMPCPVRRASSATSVMRRKASMSWPGPVNAQRVVPGADDPVFAVGVRLEVEQHDGGRVDGRRRAGRR